MRSPCSLVQHLCLTMDLKFWTFWKVSCVCCDMTGVEVLSGSGGNAVSRGYEQGDLKSFQ